MPGDELAVAPHTPDRPAPPRSAFDPARARALVRLADAAYAAGADGFHFADPDLGHLGTVFESATDVVVAYRGSIVPRRSHTPDLLKASLGDWLGTNFDLAQVPALGGRVHRGWLDRLDRSWARVFARVAVGLNGRPLWVTGHSMGGAVSILAGQRFAEHGLVPAGVYAFGAPKVGDRAFAAGYAAPLYTVANRHDLVPWLPLPRWMRDSLALGPLKAALVCAAGAPTYAEVGEEWWVAPGGQLRRPTFKDRAGYRLAALLANPHRLISDHWVEAYDAALSGGPTEPET